MRVSAIRHFEATIEIGGRQFPKKIAKRRYWNDLETRPYMRGLRNLALTFNRVGRFDDAERVCAQLAGECGDDLTAEYHRGEIALNRGRWNDAIVAASRLINLYPECNFIAAFELACHDRSFPRSSMQPRTTPAPRACSSGRPSVAHPGSTTTFTTTTAASR